MKIALSLILAGSLFVTNLPAQNIIVGWGGQTVSSTQNFNGFNAQSSTGGLNLADPSRDGRLIIPTKTTHTDTLVGIPFNQTTQLSPTSGYTGQRFYGGVYAGVLNPATPQTIDAAEITNQGPNDVMSFRYALNANQHDSRLALYFDKADFLAGGNVNPVNIGASTTLNIRFAAPNSSQVNNDGEFRWIVRDSSNNWWISAADAAGRPNIRSDSDTSGAPTPTGIKANTSYSFSVANGDLSYWAPYSPTTLPNPSGIAAPFQPGMNFEPAYDSPYVITSATNPFALHTFNDITALGFYIEGDQFSTNVFQFTIESFTFSAQVGVPEPGTYLLIGVMGLGYYSLKNLRKKKPATTETQNAEQEETATENTVVAAV